MGVPNTKETLNPLETLQVNLRHTLSIAIELRARLDVANIKLSGVYAEKANECVPSPEPNGMVEEMTDTLCSINTVLGHISQQITKLENTI